MQLSPNLSMQEFTHSDTAISKHICNDLPEALLPSAQTLAQSLFEPIRSLLGVPLKVDSGFRCVELNKAVRGVATSQHTKAQALDLVPVGMKVETAFNLVKNASIPYDQLIKERTKSGSIWLHISLNTAPGAKQRQQVIEDLVKP